MNVLKLIKLFALTYPLFIAIDIIWIGYLMKPFYLHHLKTVGRFAGTDLAVNWPAALITWALIVLGSILFVLPKIAGTDLLTSALWGGLFGLVLYGTYDFTNLATLAAWNQTITAVDIGWGVTINALTAVILFYLEKWL